MPEQVSPIEPYRSEPIELNLGPHHPSTHGVFRAIVELDGEIVVDVVPHLGYLHRGYEKTCENKHYHQIIPLAERCDYMGASSNSLCFCLTVEKMLEVEVPERAQVIRVMMAELSRIFSHLFWLGTHGHDVGAMTPLFYMLREREEIMNLFELTAGGRLMPNYLRIGGEPSRTISIAALMSTRPFLQKMPFTWTEQRASVYCRWKRPLLWAPAAL
jgi:NADH-quinone oxidoreductase subunit D